MNTAWLVMDAAMGLLVIAMIVWCAARPSRRSYIPGLVLISLGVLGTSLREIEVIPRRYWLEARITYVGVALIGLILVEHVWSRRRRANGERQSQRR